MKKVLIVGGTGFLGYYATLEFVKRGWQVVTLSLSPAPQDNLMPKEVENHFGNLEELKDDEILDLLKSCSAFVFAAGVDDRYTFKKPAYEKFYNANVKSCVRFVKLAKQAGVKRGAILSSYFLYFDRKWPKLELIKHHPYIKSRDEQAKQSIKEAGDELDLMILELPYIFGSMPGKSPLWVPLIKYINSSSKIYYPRGGTNMIAVEHVAEAIVGAIEKGKAGEHYTIGDQNLTWVEFIKIILKSLGQKKKIITVPNFVTNTLLYGLKLMHILQGKEGGLNPAKLGALQTALTYFDPTGSQKELGYQGGGLEEAINKTVKACIKGRK